MNIAPESPTDQDVLEAIQHEWLDTAERAEYFPVGFGAHHWRIFAAGAPILFATLDYPSERQTRDSLEQAYAATDALARGGFTGANAPLRSTSDTFTIHIADGVLSVTPWLNGRNPAPAAARDPAHIAKLVALVRSLHASRPPKMLPKWQLRVPYDFHDSLRVRLLTPWSKGPLGEQARQMMHSSLDVVADSLREYVALSNVALDSQDRWVPTHGEPHLANQFLVEGDLLLLDWETIAFGPPEIDLIVLPWSARSELGAREDMLRMFRLEWQLTEIAEYTDWLENHHVGNKDDQYALDKLVKELKPI